MSSYISCFDIKTRELRIFKVPRSVYIYIRQLEMKLRFPVQSKLFERYPGLKPAFSGELYYGGRNFKDFLNWVKTGGPVCEGS